LAIAIGTYASTTTTFATLTTAIRNWADTFVAVAQEYTPANGGSSEQYDKNTGVPLSVSDLAWSYAVLLTTITARNGVV
jgi:glucoamylase